MVSTVEGITQDIYWAPLVHSPNIHWIVPQKSVRTFSFHSLLTREFFKVCNKISFGDPHMNKIESCYLRDVSILTKVLVSKKGAG